MCGIAGKIIRRKLESIEQDVKRMMDLLVHRGPDDKGLYAKYVENYGHVCLGHRRLSIIDLEGGHQPLSNEDNSIWIVFNGEIYNFPELKDELTKKGHIFKTNCDTEVIVHLYEELGFNCLDKLLGMFAFGIWDNNKKILFLARDRLGIKPLYYSELKDGFIFSSDLKPILVNKEINREINILSLYNYLSTNYIVGSDSIVKNIYRVLPGEYIVYDGTSVKKKIYWDLNFGEKLMISFADYKKRILGCLESSIKYRLISDVPLGSFLSGGIDSSFIAKIMINYLGSIKTFSIGFEEKSYNELPYADKAARAFNTDHKSLVVKPKIVDLLDDFVFFNDEPFGDSSFVPMYFVSELARKHVKVVLSGDGGDENFAGYPTYQADSIYRYFKKIPSFLRNSFLNHVLMKVPYSSSKVSFDYKIKQFFHGLNYDSGKAHYYWRAIFHDFEKKQLLHSDIVSEIGDFDTYELFKLHYDKNDTLSNLDRASYTDIKTWLVDDILFKVDRTSMAHSLEVRVPFLDHRFVELTALIPSNLKLHRLKGKYIFKKIVKDEIPQFIINRKKQGFNSPLSFWLRGELKNYVSDILSERNISKVGFFNSNFINSLLHDYYNGRQDNSLKIWGLFNFVLWYNNIFKGLNYPG